jgi:exodeoxyribonuclease VII large subunit
MKYLSVSFLTSYLKRKFDKDPYLQTVYVSGEISNLKMSNGNLYFTLKDENAQLSANMWRNAQAGLTFKLENGMKVNAIGSISIFERFGNYSINVKAMQEDGIGSLAQRFELLKQKLTSEGFFDQSHKKALPQFVTKIGVVTAPTGAVIHDIINTVRLRYPGVEVVLYPAKVQGQGAAQEIATQIQRASQRQDLDVLIVGRGGGSMEDLWAFNEEEVVRAIFASPIPVISSVGHETDTTLSDFVADQRASTPTQAVEYAIPVTKQQVFDHLHQQQVRLRQRLEMIIKLRRKTLEQLTNHVIFRQPERLYDGYVQRLDHLTEQMVGSVKMKLQEANNQTERLHQALLASSPVVAVSNQQQHVQNLKRQMQLLIQGLVDSKQARAEQAMNGLLLIDPDKIVARGYAVIEKNDHIVTKVAELKTHDHVQIRLQDGSVSAEIL